MKVENELKLPKKPIERNNIKLDEKVKDLILGKIEINKPRRNEEKVFIVIIVRCGFIFISLNFW